MLFTNQFQPDAQPYFSDPTKDPLYEAKLAKLKKEQTWADIGLGIGSIASSAAGAVGSFIPGLGAASSIGKSAIGFAQKGTNHLFANKENQLYNTFETVDHGPGGAGIGNEGANTSNMFSGLSSAFSNNKGLMSFLSGVIQKNKDNAFSQDNLQNSKNNFLKNIDNTPGTAIDTSTTGGGTGIVNPMVGGDTATQTTLDFKRGGLLNYAGGGLLPGAGEDKIALVDTEHGTDTGVRVAAGEMLVVSKDNLEALHKALAKNDHKGVFSIMKTQMKEAPTVKDGKHGFAGGGQANTEDPYKTLSDAELAALTKEIGIGGRISGDKETALKQEIKRRGLSFDSTGAEGDRTALQNWVNPVLLGKDGKAITPDDKFDYFKWANGVKTFNEPKTIKEGTVYASPLMEKNYSNASDAVYKNGQWHHTGENGAPIEDKDLQQQITTEYLAKQEQRIGATKDKPTTPTVPYQSPELSKTAPLTTNNLPVEKVAPTGPDPTNFSGVKWTDHTAAPTGQDPTDFSKINWTPAGWNKADGDVPEPDAKTGPSAGDYAKYYAPEALGTGFDIARGILGWNAANKPLPTFTKPEAWNSYVNRLHGLSETGLTGNEMTAAQRGIDQTYAYDVNNIRDLSGGNAGMALGNLGRAASSHYGAQTNLAALNDEARARNLAQYGGALSEDVNLNRMIFGDKYNETMATKQAGAKLVNDAITNIGQRNLTNQFYGPGSHNWALDQLNEQQMADAHDSYKKSMDYYATHPFTAPPVSSMTAGTQVIGGKKYQLDASGNYVPVQ